GTVRARQSRRHTPSRGARRIHDLRGRPAAPRSVRRGAVARRRHRRRPFRRGERRRSPLHVRTRRPGAAPSVPARLRDRDRRRPPAGHRREDGVIGREGARTKELRRRRRNGAVIVLLLSALLTGPAARAGSPLDVVVMVDVSHSVAVGVVKRDRALLHDAGIALAGALRPGDAARLGTFGDTIALDTTRLREAAAIRSAADALGERIGGASPIWYALVTAASALADGSGRRGIVLVTDGRSTGNRIGFAEALD